MNSAQLNDAAPCELCTHADFEIVARQDRHGDPLETVLCRQCGLIRHAKIPTDERLAAFYEDSYREQYHGETAPSDRRVMRAWAAANRIYGRMRERIGEQARVLEIGAGIGCTVKRFAQAGCEAWGVEPHRGFCQYGCDQLDVNLQNQSIDDIQPDESHDLVLLIHVIEHFNHPLRAFEQIAAVTKPGGLLYVECPNLAAPFARKSKMFHFAHIYNFSPTTLESMARRAGYERIFEFADRRSSNIEMLFRRSHEATLEWDPAGYKHSLDAPRRASGLRYYLRRDYWSRRIERLTAYTQEFFRATSMVNDLQSDGQNIASQADPRRAA